MKAISLIVVGVLALTPLAGSAETDQRVTVTGTPDAAPLSRIERAMNACSQQFVSEILPQSSANVRIASASAGPQPFAYSSENPTGKIDVRLDARASGSGELLATANCSANRFASVKNLKLNIRDADALAALTLSDIQLVASIR